MKNDRRYTYDFEKKRARIGHFLRKKSLLKTVSERRVTEKKSLGRSRKETSSDIIDEVGACEIKTQ